MNSKFENISNGNVNIVIMNIEIREEQTFGFCHRRRRADLTDLLPNSSRKSLCTFFKKPALFDFCVSDSLTLISADANSFHDIASSSDKTSQSSGHHGEKTSVNYEFS